VNQTLPERPFRPGMYRFHVLARHLPSASAGAKWLDLGGGAGEFSVLAAQRGYEVVLVDSDRRNIENAGALGVPGVLADLNAPLNQFPNTSFEGASLIEIVEHVPQAERLVSEAFRVLKSGGLLLLSTPNAVWWKGRLRVLCGRTPEAEGYHYRFFTVAAARSLCETAGFEVSWMEFSSPAFGLNWINRRLFKRTRRVHVGIPAPLARLLAQTIYVIGKKP
jgi:SAM-dependent methyltransferase